MTVWELVDAAARARPDRVLVADEHGRSLTAAQLRESAERVAAGLGVGPGDVVAWQLPTVLESVVLMLALARVGAVQVPIIPLLREREVRLITAQVGASLFVAPDSWRGFGHAAMARQVAEDVGFAVRTVDLDGDVGTALRLPVGDPASLPPPPEGGRACRWIYFTSGTTAAPKGVRHTDDSVISTSRGMTDGLGINDGDVYPIAWPVTHIGGITMTTAVLRAGGRLVLFETFEAATFGDRVAAVRPTILGTGLPFFRAFLDAQRRHGDEPLYPGLRTCVAGGAATPPEIVRELVRTFGITGVVNCWGLTEFPIASAPSPTDPYRKLETTVGPPSPGVEVRTVDGELRLKGPQCFLGYVDSTLDEAAFDAEGWLRTGDLGEIDGDGFITVTGRLKDVIIRSGENISSLEIEDILLRHPDVTDAAVIGLPDPRTGERVCAVVVPLPGATITLDGIATHFAEQGVARQKTPEQVEVVSALERNPMGKVLKTRLRARILAAATAPVI